LTAHTIEIDDVNAAVNDILGQLDINRNLLKNSTGLIFCYVDFVESGVMEAVSGALPFDVLGCTTQGIAVPGFMGEDMLAVAVLTSDDVEFSVGLSGPLDGDREEKIAAMYQETEARLSGPPSLLLVLKPVLSGFLGEIAVAILDRLSKGIPMFGGVALDMDTNVRFPKTFHNGAAYADRLVILLVSGDVEPQFHIDSLPDKKIRNQQAVITAAEGNRMISVNNIPARTYLEQIGLINNGIVTMLYAFPLFIDNHDGEKPWSCVISDIGPDGSLLCGSTIRPGSALHIGSPPGEDVLTTAAHIIDLAKQGKNRDGLLIFSCFSRNVALVDSRDEMALVQRMMADSSLPYIFLYSTGEICPHCTGDGTVINRFYQYSIISCML
jgi:hypothetical protein